MLKARGQNGRKPVVKKQKPLIRPGNFFSSAAQPRFHKENLQYASNMHPGQKEMKGQNIPIFNRQNLTVAQGAP